MFYHIEKGIFHARQLHIIKFKAGITRQDYLEGIKKSKDFKAFNPKYPEESYLGEKDGHFAVMMIVTAKNDDELVEVFNGKIISRIRERHGEECINEVITSKVTFPLRIHRNYMPIFNMQNGVIKKDWLDEWIHIPDSDNE